MAAVVAGRLLPKAAGGPDAALGIVLAELTGVIGVAAVKAELPIVVVGVVLRPGRPALAGGGCNAVTPELQLHILSCTQRM